MISTLRRKIQITLENAFIKGLYYSNRFVNQLSIASLKRLYNWSIDSIKSENGLFLYTDSKGYSINFTRKIRAIRYRLGIQKKLNSLQDEYCTKNIEIPSNSIVIDIGANIGEFSKYWEDKNHIVYAFEPDSIEFKALKANLKSKNIFNFGLWEESTTLEFFAANETGDSSFIPNKKDERSIIKIEVKKLDDFDFEKLNIGLIKLEAEGAEPEIIRGGLKTFKLAKYVSVDVGPERGPNNASTLVQVINLLINEGFSIINFNSSRYSILFVNDSV